MTDVEQLMMQMEFSDESRRSIAEELTKLRRVRTVCQAHHRRLPHQVQTALREPARETEMHAPDQGVPDLFHQTRTA